MARLLIVEDNEASREMLAKRLRRIGHEVALAADGEQGWKLARATRFDAVILDLGLPDISGYEWAQRAKEQECFMGMPILAWTAHARMEERSQALKCGCDAVVTKPLNWVEFSKVLEGLLGLRSRDVEVINQ